MGAVPPEKVKNVLYALVNGVKEGLDGTELNIEWFNQEDVLSTLKRTRGKGIEKPTLRIILEELVKRGFVNKREAQIKTQSKGEYQINQYGKDFLIEWNKVHRGVSDIFT